MDGIDPGAYLGSLMQQPTAGKAPPTSGDIDAQILSLLKQAPAADAGAGAIDMNSPGAYAQAAATAANKWDSTPQTVKLGWPGHELNTHIPLPNWAGHTLAGMGGRAYQLASGLGQSLGLGAPNPLTSAASQQTQSTGGGKVGSFLMDSLLTAPLGGAATQGVAKLGGVGARLAGSMLGRAAVQGAVQGAVTAPPGQRLEGAGLGAALSPVLPLVGGALGKIASGLTRTPEAQALLNRGVQLTPGQMNPTGAVTNRLEQAMTAVPLVGGKIANARAAAAPQYARSMLEDALAPGAAIKSTSDDFNDMVAEGKQGFDNAYDSTLRSTVPGGGFPMSAKILNTTGPDVPLSKAFQNLAARPRLGLTQIQRQGMGQQLQDQLNETIAVAKRSGGLQADDLQQLRSSIRDAARDVSPVDNASRAQQGFWNDAQQTVTAALKSQLPPQVSSALDDIDQQYAKFAIVRNAARMAKDNPSGPTPQNFSEAIKQATAPNDYAAGGGWNRDLSKAARDVFQSTVPHTGLTGAGMVSPVVHGIEGLGALALGATHPLAALGGAGVIGAGLGAYTKPGLRALAGQTGWQQALRGAAGTVAPGTREVMGRYARAGLLSGAIPQLQGGLLSGPAQ